MLCIAVAISLVNVTVTKEAERTLEREIIATGAQVDQLRAERTQTFTLMARLIADSPTLKAAMTTNDPPTVQGIAGGYQAQLNASLVLVTNNRGEVLYAAGGSPRAAAIAAHQPALQVRWPDTRASACWRSRTASCRSSPCRSCSSARATRSSAR